MRLLKLAALVACCIASVVQAESLDCDPCIERKNYKIRAIYHGDTADPFWQQVSAAAIQAAENMGVELEVTLYEEFSPEKMAQDIIQVIANPPDALIVSIPAQVVETAVKQVVDAGIPVFGCNSGYKVAIGLGVLAHVAQDDYVAGVEAAKEFIKISEGEIGSSLLINHEKGNTGIEDRWRGFYDTILKATGIESTELVIDGFLDDDVIVDTIRPAFTDCPYDIIQITNARTIDLAVSAFSDGLFANCTRPSLLGSFDLNKAVNTGITEGEIAFGVSQEQYLQGAIPVVLATMFMTTGKIPANPSGPYGIYLSGPSIINQDKVLTDTDITCIDDAFPVCPNTKALDGTESGCPCTERSQIRIGGVLHGVISDLFWDPVFAAAESAAKDFNINLDLERFDDQASVEILHRAMAAKISDLCNDGVDGVFVTIPSDLVVGAIKRCQDLGIPVISVNAGAEVAADLGLIYHIGMLEYNAGYAAGKKLIESGITEGWCLNHDLGTQTTLQRCAGFAAALADDSSVNYAGQIIVDRNTASGYKLDVELRVGDVGDWAGIGLLLVGAVQLTLASTLLEAHPSAVVGTFDLNDDVFDALGKTSLSFGIDQQPYLQGYLPIPLLALAASTKTKLVNPTIESGPNLVLAPPSEAQQICEANFYDVCDGTSSQVETEGTAPPEEDASTRPTRSFLLSALVSLLFYIL
jgi:simple sugar transport system substrate-binding protein